MDYRLVHFNCARPLGAFSRDNAFVQVFIAMLPRIFQEADKHDGLVFHHHGLRCADGSWRDFETAFPYPEDWASPDIATLGVWRSLADLKAFAYDGRTHLRSMTRLAGEIDRSQGPSFAMWWAPQGVRFTMEDGWQRLAHLRAHGPSGFAFGLDSLCEKPQAA